MTTVAERRRAFRALHESGCFVLPNPWDVGSARYLASLGFAALATTSSGAAWSLGEADGAVPLEPMLDHIKRHRGGHRSAGERRFPGRLRP